MKWTPLTTTLSVHVFSSTYRRSCFRPLCLPWCHPAASGGRSRVCSRAAWRCPSAGALQSKHSVKHTLAPGNTHTLVRWHILTHTHTYECAHWLNKRQVLIFTLWNSQTVKCMCVLVCVTVAFSRIDGTWVSAKKKHLSQAGSSETGKLFYFCVCVFTDVPACVAACSSCLSLCEKVSTSNM